jgi:cytoskeletal protein RodZ
MPDKSSQDSPDTKAVETFGRYLARERELRGMTLEQVSEQTRIGTSNLRALESDDPSRLPARVFVLGYIRAYANAIGLSADEAVLRFDEQCQQNQPAADSAVSRKRPRRVLAGLAALLAVAAAVAYFLAGP